MPNALPIAALTASICLLAPAARADTINVPADHPTVQGAINASFPGDVIVLAPGTYREAIDTLGKAVTLRSSDPTNPLIVAITTLSGRTSGGAPLGTVITCDSGESATTIFDGLTIANAQSTEGAGAFLSNTSPTFRRCVFTQSTAQLGAAISARLGAPTIESCAFILNTADDGIDNTLDLGGAIHARDGSVTIRDCLFQSNSGETGSAVYIRETSSGPALIERCAFTANRAETSAALAVVFADATVADCSFESNTAETAAACIDTFAGADVAILSSIFRRNTGVSTGAVNVNATSLIRIEHCAFEHNLSLTDGALRLDATAALVHASRFVNNTAAASGAAITDRSTSLTINACLFAANSANTAGAVRPAIDGSSTIANSVFIGNAATIGGAIFTTDDHATTIVNCAFIDNDAATGRAIFFDAPSAGACTLANSIIRSPLTPVISGPVTADHSLIQGGYPGTAISTADPMFTSTPDDGGDGWRDNPATPTIDESANNDYADLTPLPSSPALDAARNNALPTDSFDIDADANTAERLPLDYTLRARFFDDPAPDTGIGASPLADIGPIERAPSSCNPADLAPDFGVLDFSDILAFLQAFGSADPAADLAPPVGVFDFSDVFAFLQAFASGCP